MALITGLTLHWRHNNHNGISNHQPHGCLLNHLFRRRSKKTSKHRITGLCVGNSPGKVNSPHKGPVTRKMFPFDDVIMFYQSYLAAIMAYGWLFSLGTGENVDHLWNLTQIIYVILGRCESLLAVLSQGLIMIYAWYSFSWNSLSLYGMSWPSLSPCIVKIPLLFTYLGLALYKNYNKSRLKIRS